MAALSFKRSIVCALALRSRYPTPRHHSHFPPFLSRHVAALVHCAAHARRHGTPAPRYPSGMIATWGGRCLCAPYHSGHAPRDVTLFCSSVLCVTGRVQSSPRGHHTRIPGERDHFMCRFEGLRAAGWTLVHAACVIEPCHHVKSPPHPPTSVFRPPFRRPCMVIRRESTG